MKTLPYGAWPSPITPDAIVADTVRLSAVSLDAGRIGWLEGRPGEGGRNVLVRAGLRADVAGTPHDAGRPADATPPPFNVRSRVHEYGGGAYAVSGDRIWFSNDPDGRIYVQAAGAAPVPLTAEGSARFADLVFDPVHRRLLAVRETHRDGAPPANDLVEVSITGGAVRVLASGHDFYAAPAPGPDGRRLAWLAWDQPDMPWDAATLYLADLDRDGLPGAPRRIAGGPGCAAFQPAWSPDGALWCVADPDGWWNLHRWRDGALRCMYRADSEFGKPLWQLGTTTFGFDAAGCVVCTWRSGGAWRLGRLDPDGGAMTPIPLPWTSIDSLVVDGSTAAFIGGAPDRSAAVVSVDLESGESRVHRVSSALSIDGDMLSRPVAISFPSGGGYLAGGGFPTGSGHPAGGSFPAGSGYPAGGSLPTGGGFPSGSGRPAGGGEEVTHGYYYPPCNASCRGPAGESPPLLVMSHGGPTGAASDTLNPTTQFWTSRGFAVLDVDYRGSTGYGRAYRERLYGAWGVADVEDCVAGALHLADTGRADRDRLAIRGSSAGGYTTLAALTFHDVFRAGASYYGICDLEVLAADTHKFEARYLDRLVGAWPAERDVYRARSPLHHAARLGCPIIFFQGLDDRVVPPNQAELMVDALDRRGLPVAYLRFEGEGHGFRKAATIRRCLEAELFFYARVFGFELADAPAPADAPASVEIRNLSGSRLL